MSLILVPRPGASGSLTRLLSLSLVALLGACYHGSGTVSNGTDSGTDGSITVNHADGSTETILPGSPSTPSNVGSLVAPSATPVVADKPIPVADSTILLMLGNRSGASQLGEIYRVNAAANTSSVVKTFTGRPWSSSEGVASNGLVFNAADGRFYGVLDRVGLTHDAGVLYAFDPKTDTFTALKTLSNAGVGSVAGLNGTTVRDLPRGGFERKPLLSRDGKSAILLASWGGRDDRGMLIQVNLDATSAAYLKETVVYDFFSYEESRGDTCQSLEGIPTELVWGKDAVGQTVVFMGREGVAYTLDPSNPDPTHPKCNTLTDQGTGKVIESKFGQVFRLQPSDAGDLSKPWVYAGSEAVLKAPLYVSLGRRIGFDSYRNKVRWTTENKADGELGLYSGGSTIGNPAHSASKSGTWDTGCFRLTGMVMTDSSGTGILLCGGLNGSDPATSAAWVKDQPPMLFTHRGGNGELSFQASFNDWYASKLSIDGATWGEASRRLYLTGGAGGSAVDGRVKGYADVSRIEEVNTYTLFSRRTLAKGSLTGSGFGFFGDPAVGGSASEPINDRYVVWLGTVVAGASMTLNKYDRYTDQTTTIRFETDAGAHPWGKLLDLGNGLAMGRMENTPPKYGSANPDKVGGYRGAIGWGNAGAQPGVFTMNVRTGQIVSMAAQDGGNFSPELARTDDGLVWGIRYSEWNNNGYLYEQLRKIDPATGRSVVILDNNRGTSEKLPVRRHSPEARGNAVYGIWYNSFLTPAQAPSSTNETVFCQRSDDLNVKSFSGVIGPNDQSGLSTPRVTISGDAHATVEGPTYSPTHDALYLATRRVGATDAVTIFEIDKGVSKAALCRQTPVLTRIASSGAADVPVTKILVTRAGMLVYGSVSGKLMKIDPTARTITMLADLKTSGAASSQIKGFLTEVADGTLGAIVHDFDAAGRNIGRRLAGVSTTGSQVGSHDVSRLIGESEPYPGVNRFN
jgi:hypothetical protein